MSDFFETGAQNFGVSLDSSMTDAFERFFNRLIEENEKYNLTAITEKDKVYLLHFLDSISASSFIPINANVCDIGTGGGFPAIPLKIVRDDLSITMLDSVNKKVNFLNETISIFGFSNCKAIHTRIEDFAKGPFRESFDVVTSRAVAKLPTLLEYALPLVKVGGIFIAYKSDAAEELSQSKNALKIFGGSLLQSVDVNVSNELTRTLLVFKKVKPTPKNFPRGKNRERLDPII